MRSAAKQGRHSRQSGLIGHRQAVGVAGADDSHRSIMSPDDAVTPVRRQNGIEPMIDAVLNTSWLSWNRTHVQRAIQLYL